MVKSSLFCGSVNATCLFRHIWLISTALCALVIIGCSSGSKQSNITNLQGRTMGTTYHVSYIPVEGTPQSQQIQSQLDQLLATVNQQMSTYIDDSEISTFNRSPVGAWYDVSPATVEVVDLAIKVSHWSSGAYDITVGPLVDLWGFGAKSEQMASEPQAEQIQAAMQSVGFQGLHLRTDPPALKKLKHREIDLSSVAKGYGVDVLAEYLMSVGVTSYLVEIGGELRAKGMKPDGSAWRVAIESPQDAGGRSVHSILQLTDYAIATSGDYRNYFEKEGVRYSHILNASTGKPITHKLASVTVLAETCAEADALATALLVMGDHDGLQLAEEHQVAALFIVRDGETFVERLSPKYEALLKNK